MATHDFAPTTFHGTLGSHDPVLRIADGDTVRTTTVDAEGRDASGEQRVELSNPQTGPFFITGAEPGDTLRVHLDKIWPNRDSARSSNSVAANAVDPDYVPELPAFREERLVANWAIDREAGTATLLLPTRLGRLTLELAPMLGCFGVAPAEGEAISTATSGRHGGNMDYRGFGQQVTALFPVFVPGALFFLGDGHALQGDGEIVGTGLEISMDVQFTVSVLKATAARGRAARARTTSSPSGMRVRSIRLSSTRRPRCCAGSRRTTSWTRYRRARSSVNASSTTWAMFSTPLIRWSASWQSGL